MSKVLPAKGFRDFSPAQKRRKEDLLAAIRATYLRYGFDEIETPAAEPIERLRGSEGGENLAMIFEIMQRGLTADHLRAAQAPGELADLGLRYDLTVPLARYYASNHAELPPVFRAIQMGPVWRAEKPQKGRYRQFTQCDIDILGEPSAIAEIELIVATIGALGAIGLEGAVVHINDRRLLDAVLAESGIPAEGRAKALILVDKLDKIGLEGVKAALVEAFPDGAGARLAAAFFNPDVSVHGTRAEYREVLSIIDAVRAVAGDGSIRFDPTLVRGLGYYTGPIFEVRHPAFRGSVGGGGRYDNMIGKFLGQPVPATGFSLGFDRLLEIVPDAAASPEARASRVGLIYEDGDEAASVVARQQELIGRGLSVRVVRSARNKQRMFDDLLRAGFGRVQRVSDPADSFRDLGGES